MEVLLFLYEKNRLHEQYLLYNNNMVIMTAIQKRETIEIAGFIIATGVKAKR